MNDIVSINIPNRDKYNKRSIYELKELQGSLKDFSNEAYQKLKARILEVGFKYPFYVWHDKKNNHYYYIDGHHRRKTLLKMKDEGVAIPEYYPVIEIEAKSKKEAAKELLHLNSTYGKITGKGLAGYLESFKIEDVEIKNIEIKEYTSKEEIEETKNDDELVENVQPITKIGDIWEMNNHRLICGDSTDGSVIEKLMSGEKADMVFTDPPYPNNSKIMHEMIDNIEGAFDNARTHCDSLMVWFWDNLTYPPFNELVTSKLIWHKTNGWQAGHFETMYCFHDDNTRHEQKVYSVNNVGCDNKRSKQGNHPTPKPIKLTSDILYDIAKDKNTILDLFLGSGSTMIASEKTNRRCYGSELDPHYCDVSVQRWIKWMSENDRDIKTLKLNGNDFDRNDLYKFAAFVG